jgi:hypothetical protein
MRMCPTITPSALSLTYITFQQKEKETMTPVPVRMPLTSLLRRLLPALGGLLLFWGLVFSLSAGAAGQAVEPEALGSLSGTVTVAANQPVSDVEVTVYRPAEYYGWIPIRTVTTNEAGRYLVPALRTGIYHLRLRDRQGDYAPVYYEHSPSLDGGRDVLVAGNEVTGLDVRLEPPASISGAVTIVDAIVPNYGSVSVYSQVDDYWTIVTTTAASTVTGAYDFARLLGGTYRVCAYGALEADYFTGCYGGASPEVARSISLTTGSSLANLDFQLSEGQFEGQITGKVTSSGLPLAGIQISLYWSFSSDLTEPLIYTYTNAAGAYRIGGLQDGRYRVVFSDPAGDYVTHYYPDQPWPDAAEVIPLSGGATISNINAILPRAGAISGQISFAHGWPTDTLQATVYQMRNGNWRGHVQPVETDAAGKYLIKTLEPGTYRLCMPFDLLGSFYSRYYPNCYGTERTSSSEQAANIAVVAGATTSGIDFTVGPAPVYLPVIHHP